jgi:hypothetical protein
MEGAMRTALTLTTMALLLASASAYAQKPTAAPRPLHKVNVDKGFIDDAIALSADGQQVAYVHTDGDVTTLVIEKIGGAAVKVKLQGLPPIIARLIFSPDGKNLLVVGDDREKEAKVAQVYATDGKPVKGKLGPVTDLELTSLQGAPIVMTFQTKRGKNDTTFTFAAHDLATLKLKKKKTFTADKQGLLKGLDLKVISYFDSYLKLLGQRKGDFDKKNDIRKPENRSIVDTLTGKILESNEITDPMAFAEVAKLRGERPAAEAFVLVEELKTLVLIGRDDQRAEIALPEKMLKYEPKTLQQQLAGQTIYFTLAVDPVNPDITAKGKTDRPDVDLYLLDLGTKKARRLWRLECDRPAVWHVAADRVVLLKKYKNFSRGGVDLEVLPLQ